MQIHPSPRPRFTIPLVDGSRIELGERTLVMGILNVTPDSFADGGRHVDPDVAAEAALQMVADGAGAIDVGGESTRPGARALAAEEEIARVMPVLERLHGRIRVPVAVDTYKAAVAERALERGAVIVNDVSALGQDPALAGVVARRGAAVVLMHSRGRSADMYAGARYGDVTGEIVRELSERVRAAEAAGIRRDRIIVDPGIGFAKTAAHSLRAIARLGDLHVLGCPVLSGPSRKSFLRAALGDVPPEARVWGTAAAVAASILAGAHIVRVHDVKAMVDVARTADALIAARG